MPSTVNRDPEMTDTHAGPTWRARTSATKATMAVILLLSVVGLIALAALILLLSAQ